MKRVRISAILACLLLPLAAESAPATGLAARLGYLESLGPRLEGSAAEAACLDYLFLRCAEAGLQARIDTLDRLPRAHSYSRNLTLSLPGARPERLAFLVPLDTHPEGPRGEGNAAIALMLGELLRLKGEVSEGRVLPIGVEVSFLGAEARDRLGRGGEPGLGSRSWIASAGSEPRAVVYLSIDDLPSTLELGNAGRRILSPFWHYDRARTALVESGFDYRLRANRMQVYRLGLADRPGPLVPYLEAGIPAVELRSRPGAPALPAEAEARFSALVEGLVARNAEGFLAGWDRNYLSFQLGSRSIVVQEGPYVAFLLAYSGLVLALILAFTVVRRGEAKAFLGRLPRQSSQILLLYLAASASYLSALLALAAERAILGSEEAWRLWPSLFGLVRLLVSFALFVAMLSFLVGKRILSPDPYFYEFASLACLGIDVFVFSAFMLPLSFYFVWAFLIVGLSLGLRKAAASLVAYVLMYAPLLLLTGEMAAAPELAVLDPIVRPDIGIGLLVAAAALPFYAFSASPLLFFSKPGPRARNRTALVFVGLAFAAELGLVLAARPLALRAPLELAETVDQDRGGYLLEIASAGRIGELSLRRGGQPIRIGASGGRAAYEGREARSLVGFRSRDLPFLDRTTRRITLDFFRNPYSLSLRLQGAEDLRIYDCSLPYEIALEGRAAEIFVGRNPPNPLVIELTTARDFSAELAVEAGYLEALEPYEAEGGRSLVLKSSLVKASFPFGSRPGGP